MRSRYRSSLRLYLRREFGLPFPSLLPWSRHHCRRRTTYHNIMDDSASFVYVSMKGMCIRYRRPQSTPSTLSGHQVVHIICNRQLGEVISIYHRIRPRNLRLYTDIIPIHSSSAIHFIFEFAQVRFYWPGYDFLSAVRDATIYSIIPSSFLLLIAHHRHKNDPHGWFAGCRYCGLDSSASIITKHLRMMKSRTRGFH